MDLHKSMAFSRGLQCVSTSKENATHKYESYNMT